VADLVNRHHLRLNLFARESRHDVIEVSMRNQHRIHAIEIVPLGNFGLPSTQGSIKKTSPESKRN